MWGLKTYAFYCMLHVCQQNNLAKTTPIGAKICCWELPQTIRTDLELTTVFSSGEKKKMGTKIRVIGQRGL